MMRVGIWMRAAALLLAAAVSGCAGNVNPVTGKPIYTPVSGATETYAGEKANAKMIADYGVYKEDAALTAFVDRVGQALAKNVVRKSIKYTFTVLDEDEINAFAVPGGFVYITRGALNFANSEAEVAAILGHEIGHVDAFHFRRHEDDTMSQVLSVLLRQSSKSADEIAMAQKLAEKSTRSAGYSQEQEYEADALGMHYMALAGYDPKGMLAALHTEDAKAKLDDGQMKGNALAHDIMALDQSHPATPEREARALAALKTQMSAPASDAETAAGPNMDPKVDRDAYLAAIDGMTFGDDPGEGTVDGRRLVNAALGFGFEAPEDFDLWTGHDGAFGFGAKAAMVLDTGKGYSGQSMATYVQSLMVEKMKVKDVHALELDGWRGATGIIDMDPFIIRLAAVHDTGDHLYRVMYVAHRRAFHDLDAGFIESLKSFHPLEGAEAKLRPALRLHVVTVAGGDTVQSLAERMAVTEKKLEWFRVVNGLGPDDTVKPGDKVKLVE